MCRRVLLAVAVLTALLAAASSAPSASLSPCRQVKLPAWSPDGREIVFYGRRWPPPTHAHRNPNDILQALCTARADGTDAQPLRFTVCFSTCPDPPYQLVWPRSGILFLRDGVVFRIASGSRPRRVARIDDFSFATNAAGTRIAAGAGSPACLHCSGPVTILDARSGAVVGTAGGRTLYNVDPSLSPDGARVVFERASSDGSGKPLGIWTAKTDGSRLRRLAQAGGHPLWSPVAAKVAYTAPAGTSVALRLIPAGGGPSQALIPRGVENVFGWSPDSTSIAVELGSGTFGRLAVVDVVTGKVRSLLQLAYAPTAVWSPDSTELLVNTVAKSQCWSTSRVPADGSKATLISSCRS